MGRRRTKSSILRRIFKYAYIWEIHPVTEEQKKFIADFYKYSFVGVMLDWIKRGMKEAPEEIANMVCVTMHGNVGNSLRNMEKEGQ